MGDIRIRNGAIMTILKDSDEVIDSRTVKAGEEILIPSNFQVESLVEAGIAEVKEYQFRKVREYPAILTKEEPDIEIIPLRANALKSLAKKKKKKR